MADPIPVNSRRDRNPPIPPPPPGGARPNPFGALPGGAGVQRPAALNNPIAGAAERRRADAAFDRGAVPIHPGGQPARDGGIFDRADGARAVRQQRRSAGDGVRVALERVLFVIMVVVLALLMVFISRTAPPPSVITPYAPRDASAAQLAPTAVSALPTPSGALALISAFTTRRDLVRTCPRLECLPIDAQPIIESETAVFVRARSADGRWVAISASDLRWNGWLPADLVRLTNPNSALPVLAG